MVRTALIICAELRGLILAVIRFELTGHRRRIWVTPQLPPIVSIALLVLLRRRRVARRGRGLPATVDTAGSHGRHGVLEQASIHVLVVHELLVDVGQRVSHAFRGGNGVIGF